MSTIHERMREVRKALKLTTAKMGAQIKFSQATVSLVENAKHPYDRPEKISDNYIRMIVLTFGINEQWLRTGEGEMFLTTPPGAPREALAAQVLELVEKVPPDELRRIVKEFIGALVDSSLLTPEELQRIIDQHQK